MKPTICFELMRMVAIAASSTFVAAFSGCTTYQTTSPPRAATEQLLLSTSVDRALAGSHLTIFAGQKVYLDTSYFDSYDVKYATGAIRDALSRGGALLVDSAAAGDIIIEARSGALSIDNSETLFGLPSIGAPVPLAGTVALPEIAFYKADRQHAYAKFALLAFVRESRMHLYSSGDLDGKSYDKYYRLLGASWERTDIPEKHHSENIKEEYTTWFPQYDPHALQTIANPISVVTSSNSSPKAAASTNAFAAHSFPATNAPPNLLTNAVKY
ncbi:MAG: DUF6655 family protein [Verrucomicrobiota bacterium]